MFRVSSPFPPLFLLKLVLFPFPSIFAGSLLNINYSFRWGFLTRCFLVYFLATFLPQKAFAGWFGFGIYSDFFWWGFMDLLKAGGFWVFFLIFSGFFLPQQLLVGVC